MAVGLGGDGEGRGVAGLGEDVAEGDGRADLALADGVRSGRDERPARGVLDAAGVDRGTGRVSVTVSWARTCSPAPSMTAHVTPDAAVTTSAHTRTPSRTGRLVTRPPSHSLAGGGAQWCRSVQA